jgi:hypothetical protein
MKNIRKGVVMLVENVQGSSDMFATVTHLVEGLNLEIFLTLKVGNFLISLVGTRRRTISIKSQVSSLFLKHLVRKKASRFCRLE